MYFLMFDSPHLIKCVRNNLMKYSFQFGQHVATWKDTEAEEIHHCPFEFNGAAKVTGRIKCLKGWLITLNAILLIWEHVKTNHDFRFLLTRRSNTDPLEKIFGTIRQGGGVVQRQPNTSTVF